VGGDPLHGTGAIYSLANSSARSKISPANGKHWSSRWRASKFFVDFDGQRVTTFDPRSPNLPPQKQWHGPKREHKRPEAGYIGLQKP
jgi:hypothetical protein